MNEKEKNMLKKIGFIAYAELRKAIKMSEEKPEQKIYHVTKNKKTLQEKEHIQKEYPYIIVMTEDEWLSYAFKKLKPEEQKKIKENIKEKLIKK